MTRVDNYIQQNRPALFDQLVVGTSFLLGLVYPSLSDILRSRWFSYWILCALVLYTAGAILKYGPQSSRISREGMRPMLPYLIFILAGHWVIMLFAVILSDEAFREILHLAPSGNGEANGTLIFVGMVVPTVITWFVYRSKGNRKPEKYREGKTVFYQELVADLFLVVSVSIFSFVFWEKGVMALLSRSPTHTIGDIWFLFIFLAIVFVIFYLPLRYLYDIESRTRRSNWNRLLIIFGFMLLRALFEMLHI